MGTNEFQQPVFGYHFSLLKQCYILIFVPKRVFEFISQSHHKTLIITLFCDNNNKNYSFMSKRHITLDTYGMYACRMYHVRIFMVIIFFLPRYVSLFSLTSYCTLKSFLFIFGLQSDCRVKHTHIIYLYTQWTTGLLVFKI